MNEAELLFSSILNCNRLSLYLNKEILLDKNNSVFIASVLKRRMKGEPIQYILGKTEFMGFEFKVTPDVFIPRPETEILVEEVINQVARSQGHKVTRLLDIGTGSGCIAISLAKLLSDIEITATDISEKALEIAKSNALMNNVFGRIKFIQSDLFTREGLQDACYDIIVSNPPYIPSEEIDKLQPEIKYEPRIALDGGIDGLDFYRRLISSYLRYLKRSGLLIIEIGFNQKEVLKNIFQKYADFEIIEVVKDYNGLERVMIVQKMPNV